MSEKKVQVEIDGIEYTLLTDESEEQIRDIAKYVEKKITEVKSKRLSYDKELVLTSLNIANDLFKVGNKYNNLKEDSSEAVENYPQLIEKYQKSVAHNDELIAKVEELIEKNKNLQAENTNLNRQVKSNANSTNTINKLREELKRLQQETISLKAENDKFKENL